MSTTAAPHARATTALALWVGLAPIVCLPGGYDAANLPQSAWIVVAAWLWAAALAARREGPRRWPPPVPLVSLLAWAGLSLLWAGGREPGLSLWLHWLACALVFAVARALWRSPREAAPVFAAVTVAGALVSSIGLAQAWLGWTFFPQGAPPAATFVNKNVAAGFVVLSWPFALVFLRGTRPAWVYASLLLQAVFCWRSFSRAAWLAVAAQLLVVLVWAGRRASRRARVRLVAALVLAALAAVPAARLPGPVGETLRHALALRHAFDERPSDDMRVLSGRGRLAVWANTLAMVRERPSAGFGLGAHARAYPLYAYAARPDPFFSARHQLDFAHNDFLQTAAEQGLVGFALLVALLAAAARGMRSAWRRADAGERRYVAVAVLVGVGLCVDACFSFPLERALPPLLAALAGAAAGASRDARPAGAWIPPAWCRRLLRTRCGAAPLDAAPRRRRAPRALALVALALAQAFLFSRALRADRSVGRMFAALEHGNFEAARAAGARAAALDPGAFEPAFVLGRLSLDAQRPHDALRWLERALVRRPHDAATLGTRAEAWALAGDSLRAADDARRAAELLPRDARAQYEAGRRLERVGRVEDARRAYERACALDPGRPEYHLRLGVSAMRAGRRAQAVDAAQAALRLDPRLALGHKLLGLVLLGEADRRAEARGHLRHALTLDPNISDAERLRGLLEEPDR